MLIIPPPRPVIYLMADPMPAIAASVADTSFLAQLAPSYFTDQGYTVLYGDDLTGYSTTAGLISGANLSSRNGWAPITAMVRKIPNDPIFPNRSMEWCLPYNNDCTGCTGSAGELPNQNFTWGTDHDSIWYQFFRRMGGTLHPLFTFASDYSNNGAFPSSSANAIKCFFVLWQGGDYNGGRLGYEQIGATFNINFGFGTQPNSPVGTEDAGTDATLAQGSWGPGGTKTGESETFTGREVIRFAGQVWRVSDDLFIWRRYWQQMTVNGLLDPQKPYFTFHTFARTSGAVLPYTRHIEHYANKNKTTTTNGLSTTTWDNPDQFSTDSLNPGTERAEGDKPFKGQHLYMKPYVGVTGGDGRPLHDYRGNNLADYGLNDPAWPL